MSAATEYFPANITSPSVKAILVNFGAIGYGYWGPNVVQQSGWLGGSPCRGRF